ncbi:uncharacterized protein EV422DRAFT_276952 [Fimicolochytrium jonesii]|uniref:uncharacterized protein n=1 Tax=Fimicolochytrium jonesii TaxID=1396493 RepID=UPI0022FEE15C|nr:uncharacterized protein EV422DRAFT_276952 [Fimicolochytrium jonesii]KAI8816736.1 hypothetical protein EV422DRAFT_276952 [Fimicolochytrium jonesii]
MIFCAFVTLVLSVLRFGLFRLLAFTVGFPRRLPLLLGGIITSASPFHIADLVNHLPLALRADASLGRNSDVFLCDLLNGLGRFDDADGREEFRLVIIPLGGVFRFAAFPFGDDCVGLVVSHGCEASGHDFVECGTRELRDGDDQVRSRWLIRVPLF